MSVLPPFPASRPRRLRRDAFSRELVREHRVCAGNLILTVFVIEGDNKAEDIVSMPGVQRLTIDRLFAVAEECLALGVPVAVPFAVYSINIVWSMVLSVAAGMWPTAIAAIFLSLLPAALAFRRTRT